MWEALLQWLRKEPVLAQWVASFATLAAIITAFILALLPVWLDKRDKKRKATRLRDEICVAVLDLRFALQELQHAFQLNFLITEESTRDNHQNALRCIERLRMLLGQAEMLQSNEYEAFVVLISGFPDIRIPRPQKEDPEIRPMDPHVEMALSQVEEFLRVVNPAILPKLSIPFSEP